MSTTVEMPRPAACIGVQRSSELPFATLTKCVIPAPIVSPTYW
jgi:hypothetical protein